jgi:outer membrane lipoprotein carrier protein
MPRIIALFILFFAETLWADASGKLISQLQAMESLKGDYQQTITDKKGTLIQKTHGNFVMKRPGYFFWASQGAQEQQVIGNPQNLWVYDPDLDQVTVRKQDLQNDKSPARLLSGDVAQLAPQFSVAEKKSGKLQTFVLTPKQKGHENFADIEFVFADGKLSAMAFTDKLGQHTQLQLQNTQSNIPVDMALFNFVPKPGTDVIEND